MALRILIRVGEQSWPWDAEVSLSDAKTIKSMTGLGVLDFHNGVLRLDPDCCQTVVWMCRRQTEPALKLKEVDFHFGEGGFAWEDLDDEVPTSEPNLTAPTPITPPSATNGSEPSPPTSESTLPVTTG